MNRSELEERCHEFARRHSLCLIENLGAGVQGIVFLAESQVPEGNVAMALKAHIAEPGYLRERDAYLRLRDLDLTSIRECNVPILLDFDDDAWIIAMSVVKRPFVLDFGGAYLDEPPDFPDEVIAEWNAEKREQFGDRWPEVRAIINELQMHGIYLVDVNPGNISFGV